MTESQKQAWGKAAEILKEHFDHVLLVVDTEAPDNTDRIFDAMWHGGLSTAIGLAERARMRLCSRSEIPDSPSEES